MSSILLSIISFGMNFQKSLLTCRIRCFHYQYFYTKIPSSNKLSLRIEKRPLQILKNIAIYRNISALYLPVLYRKSSHLAASDTSDSKRKLAFDIQPVHFDNSITFEQPVKHEDLIEALEKCKSIEEQMIVLAETLSLTEEDIRKRKYFGKVIESMLKPFFEDLKIQLFGSSVNGLGFKGCDIDMSFQTSVHPQNENLLEMHDTPSLTDLISGRITPMDVSHMPSKEKVLFIHSIFLEYYRGSINPATYINAYIPIIRFNHDEYNLKCDLSCGNKVAFLNTKLLYLYGKFDERVKPFLMTIRYWAKHNELIGKGLMFNTYTISLLTIFFLQTRNPPIIPSTEAIILTNNFDNDDMEDKSFLDLIKCFPSFKNTQTLEELLKEFFFYFLYFDYTRVICPLTATSIPRDEFFSDEKNKKFRMNTICIQDPLLLKHNVADLVDYKHCKKLFFELMKACLIFQNPSLFCPNENKWSLLSIMHKLEEISIKQIYQDKVMIKIPPISKNVLHKHKEIVNKELLTAYTILDILDYVLLFECQILQLSDIINILKKQDSVKERKKKILSELAYKPIYLNKKGTTDSNFDSDVSEFKSFIIEHKLLLSAHCKLIHNTWLGRTHVNIDNDDILEKERLISLKASENNANNSEEKNIKSFNFLYECYTPSQPSESLIIQFRALERASFNPILAIFLKEYIPKLFKNINHS